MTGSTNKNTVL